MKRINYRSNSLEETFPATFLCWDSRLFLSHCRLSLSLSLSVCVSLVRLSVSLETLSPFRLCRSCDSISVSIYLSFQVRIVLCARGRVLSLCVLVLLSLCVLFAVSRSASASVRFSVCSCVCGFACAFAFASASACVGGPTCVCVVVFFVGEGRARVHPFLEEDPAPPLPLCCWTIICSDFLPILVLVKLVLAVAAYSLDLCPFPLLP